MIFFIPEVIWLSSSGSPFCGLTELEPVEPARLGSDTVGIAEAFFPPRAVLGVAEPLPAAVGLVFLTASFAPPWASALVDELGLCSSGAGS